MEGKKDNESSKEEENETTTPKGARSTAGAESLKRTASKGPTSRESARVKTADATPETGLSEAKIQTKASELPVPDSVSKEKVPSAQRSEAGQKSEIPSMQTSETPVPVVQISEAPVPSTQKSDAPITTPQKSDVPILTPQKSEAPIPTPQKSEVPIPTPQKSEGRISVDQTAQVPVSSTVQISEPSGPGSQRFDVPVQGGQLSDQAVPSKRSLAASFKGKSDSSRVSTGTDKLKTDLEGLEELPPEVIAKKRTTSRPEAGGGFVGCLANGFPSFENFSCAKFIGKRSPFVHNPPRPEERRPRIDRPRSPRDYIINLREDLADFQESHGLPRSRDYSFMSLGLALAQETARAICSVFLMFSELFPVIAIISLVLRFALDKLIDILETNEPILKLKKTLIFCLQMVMILIPLWILIGTIVLPLAGLLLSIFRKLIRFKGVKTGRSCSQPKKQAQTTAVAVKKIEAPKSKPPACGGGSA